jgi:hypothetical protein
MYGTTYCIYWAQKAAQKSLGNNTANAKIFLKTSAKYAQSIDLVFANLVFTLRHRLENEAVGLSPQQALGGKGKQ